MFLEESIEIKNKYRNKFVSADEAVRVIKSGDRVYIHPGCSFPEILVDAMARRKDELNDVEVCHLLGVGNVAYATPEMEGHFRHNALFHWDQRTERSKRRKSRFYTDIPI